MDEGDPAVGLGQAMGDIILLRMREREMKQTILDQAQRIKDHEVVFAETTGRLKKRIAELEEAQVGQQLADQKVAYANAESARVEKNELLTREGWAASKKVTQAAIVKLEKHECILGCDGTVEVVLAILKKAP